jgi:excisionase family DNA binding protein
MINNVIDSNGGIVVATVEQVKDLIASVVEATLNKLNVVPVTSSAKGHYTIDEAAELLGVNKSTLWSWDKKGILPKVEVGGRRYYLKKDLDEVMRGGRHV